MERILFSFAASFLSDLPQWPFVLKDDVMSFTA